MENCCLAVQHERGPRKAKQHPPLAEKQQASPTIPALSHHHLNGSRLNMNTAQILNHHRYRSIIFNQDPFFEVNCETRLCVNNLLHTRGD